MSCLVTRPPMPLPAIWAISTPCSSAMRRTAGEERTRNNSISSAISPFRLTGMRWLGSARPVRSPFASGEPFLPGTDPTGSMAGIPVPPVSSIRQSPVPTGTVVAGSTRISTRTPATGEGTSVLTLSLSTSSSGSYLSTRSPTCFSQVPIVPSVTLSPSFGIVIVVAVSVGIESSGCRSSGMSGWQ